MILIADSGATKTSWALLKEEGVTIHDTAGFNPYYMDSVIIKNILSKYLSFPYNCRYTI
jgi:hypothetical protein